MEEVSIAQFSRSDATEITKCISINLRTSVGQRVRIMCLRRAELDLRVPLEVDMANNNNTLRSSRSCQNP